MVMIDDRMFDFLVADFAQNEESYMRGTSNYRCSGNTVTHIMGDDAVYRRRTMANHGFLGDDYLPLSWGGFSSRHPNKKRTIYIVDPPNLKRHKLVHGSTTDGDHHKNHKKVSPMMQSQNIRLKPKQTPKKKKITQKKKQKKERTRITYFGPTPPPDLDRKYRDYIGRMGGTDIHLVIQKPIYDSDLKEVLNRLSIPVSKFDENMIFTEKECSAMRTKIDGNLVALAVPLIDIDLHTTHMISVKRWNMGKANGTNNPTYVLTTTWNYSNARKNLAPGDIIQLWSFRVESRLHLVLLLVETKPEEGELVPLLLNN